MPVEIEVPTEHLHESLKEAHEHHHGNHHGGGGGPSWISTAALAAAVLAVAAAVSALLAGHHANEAMLEQMKATDQWSYYQAKGIKMSQVETKLEILSAIGQAGSKDAHDEDKKKLEKYEKQQDGIKEKAEELEHSSEEHMGHHVKLARAVTAYQVAIAACAIAVLSKRPVVWYLGLVLGALGTIAFVLGLI